MVDVCILQGLGELFLLTIGRSGVIYKGSKTLQKALDRTG
jgi:hypothetical protein